MTTQGLGLSALEPSYTVEQVAEANSLSKRTIYREIEAGNLKAVRFGKRALRIPASALNEYISKMGA